jgi:hypothetical protein
MLSDDLLTRISQVTPNFALGANCALESSVVLLNEINRMHKGLKPGEKPSRVSISAMLHRYQQERKPRMQAAFDASAILTRLQACDGNLNHFIMRYVFPVQGQASYADKLAELCCGAPKLEFLPVSYPNPATFKWKDEPQHVPAEPKKHSIWGKAQKGVVMELASLLSVVFLVIIVFGSDLDHTLSTARSLNASTDGLLRR